MRRGCPRRAGPSNREWMQERSLTIGRDLQQTGWIALERGVNVGTPCSVVILVTSCWCKVGYMYLTAEGSDDGDDDYNYNYASMTLENISRCPVDPS